MHSPDPGPDSVAVLSRRVAQLERRGRRTTLALVGMLGLGALGATVVAPRVEVVQAERFEVVDQEGEVRGSFGVDDVGSPRLSMKDAAGKERVAAYLKGQETYLVLRDAKGLTRIGLSIDSGPHPHVVLTDKDQKPRAHLVLGDSGHGSLIFVHEDGRMPAGLGADRDGKPWLKLGDEMVSELPAAAPGKSASGGGEQQGSGK